MLLWILSSLDTSTSDYSKLPARKILNIRFGLLRDIFPFIFQNRYKRKSARWNARYSTLMLQVLITPSNERGYILKALVILWFIGRRRNRSNAVLLASTTPRIRRAGGWKTRPPPRKRWLVEASPPEQHWESCEASNIERPSGQI